MKKQIVIFLHGISSKVIREDYSQELQANILQKLSLPDPSLITFETINYSAIGQTEEESVLEAYKSDRQKQFNVLDNVLENVVFENMRVQIVTAFSDALVYESEYWRTKIRNLLLEKINSYVDQDVHISIIGHSLGSVVAFDTIYYNTRHNPNWLNKQFKIQNLFTLGSPIALFSLELDSEYGGQKPRYIPMDMMPSSLNPQNTNPDLQIVHKNWINFFDAQDIIGYPLETLFKDKFTVKDILVQNGTNPINAHSDYWKNQQVASVIAESLR